MMICFKKYIVWILVVYVSLTDAYAQCAMCRAVLESEEGQKAAEGINNGIVYLMIIPYILIAGVGYFIYRSKRNIKNTTV